MKTIAAVFLGSLLLANSALALSGTVTGSILFDDERLQTSTLSGANHVNRSGGSLDPLVGARVILLGGGGASIGESTTTSTGQFSIAWNDSLAFSGRKRPTIRFVWK